MTPDARHDDAIHQPLDAVEQHARIMLEADALQARRDAALATAAARDAVAYEEAVERLPLLLDTLARYAASATAPYYTTLPMPGWRGIREWTLRITPGTGALHRTPVRHTLDAASPSAAALLLLGLFAPAVWVATTGGRPHFLLVHLSGMGAGLLCAWLRLVWARRWSPWLRVGTAETLLRHLAPTDLVALVRALTDIAAAYHTAITADIARLETCDATGRDATGRDAGRPGAAGARDHTSPIRLELQKIRAEHAALRTTVEGAVSAHAPDSGRLTTPHP